MRPAQLLFTALVLASMAGCSSKSAPDDGGNNTACSVTLSGAITATSACTLAATYGRNMVGRSDLSILTSGSPGFTLGITKDGQFGSGTITESSAGVEMAVTTASNNSLLWSQDIRDPVHGSVTVVVTSLTVGSDGYTDTMHGTADGTLTPSQATPGATGNVTFHVIF